MSPTAFGLSLQTTRPNEKQVAAMISARPQMSKEKLIKLKQYIESNSHISIEYAKGIDLYLSKLPKTEKKETPKLRPTTKWESAVTESDFDLMVANKLHQLKHSATTRNKEFNLTFADVKKLVKRKTCHYTGLKFDPSLNDYQLTIDRVDSNIGYVRGNVVACLNAVNAAKEHMLEREGAFFKGNPKLLLKMISKI